MTEPVNLAPWLRRFLAEYIVTERNLARNTQASNRDTFRLLLPFVGKRARKTADRLALRDLTAERVRQFLNHLETERGCSVQTRNQRLSSIRAFARYVASRSPENLDWSAGIRAMETKKASPRPVGWLTRDEMRALLAVPDRRAERGRIEHALLLFLYNSGARVSEAAALEVGDIKFGRSLGGHDIATLRGKGGKIRQCSLWEQTADALAELVKGRDPGEAVFLSRHGRPYTRFGVYRLVERSAAAVPELEGRKSPPMSCVIPRPAGLLQPRWTSTPSAPCSAMPASTRQTSTPRSTSGRRPGRWSCAKRPNREHTACGRRTRA